MHKRVERHADLGVRVYRLRVLYVSSLSVLLIRQARTTAAVQWSETIVGCARVTRFMVALEEV